MNALAAPLNQTYHKWYWDSPLPVLQKPGALSITGYLALVKNDSHWCPGGAKALLSPKVMPLRDL